MSEENSVMVLGETSAKVAPSFTGGERQDPSKFLEEFNEAASWNNWVSRDRRKELFFYCLSGYAKEWFLNTFDRSEAAHSNIKFYNGIEESMVGLFTKKFITAEWFEKYEDRIQATTETPWEYMNAKRALHRKLGQEVKDEHSEKSIVKDIRNGHLPGVRKFCEHMEMNPYNNINRAKVDKVQELQQVNMILKHNENAGARSYAGVKVSSEGYTERQDDCVDLMERRDESSVAAGKKVEETGDQELCYNCKGVGHISKDCQVLLGVVERKITIPNSVQAGPSSSPVSVFYSGTSYPKEVIVINARSSSSRQQKSSEEVKAVLLENLRKAREAKARYRQEDELARKRGEVPPSVLRKVATGMPIMMDSEQHIQPFDMKQGLWNSIVFISLPQLRYHSPKLYHETLGHLGAQSSVVKKRSNESRSSDNMEVDDTKEWVASVNHVTVIDTTVLDIEPTLQSLLCMIGETPLEFLIAGGAIVSVIALKVVDELGFKSQVRPTNRTLRFGDGEVEAAVGLVTLKLILSEEIGCQERGGARAEQINY
ncbi:uncharacterized protein EV154DRAFT_567371 [Mucor mucedo]|uniref:uncharacterized protein n=1 Tax=Mucor mucedo TaxID=29922 RepID=UPI00221E4521|nr:uncharacterized protein EV154DRAFT_567371 [Mucor mucedo]KAI7887570.1 hypothetical protein EV154DRAFT_567371 [Mucor mucedo]